MKLSIVVPLFNEKESLVILMEKIAATLDGSGHDWEVLFVDDGSTDGSFEVVKRLGASYAGRVRGYRFSRNYGKSAALSVGINHAAGEVIITMDADLQDDPAAIPDMLAKLDEGYDLVSGWKRKRFDSPAFTIPSRAWNLATSIMSGVKLHDFNCGFKAYRSEVAKSLDIYGDRHRYLPALAHWDGFRVSEVEVPHHPRRFGKSKYGFGKFFNGVMDMLTLLFLKRYLKSPLHFFGLLGLLLMVLGGAVLCGFGVQWIATGSLHVRPLLLLSMGAIIMGIQFVSFGFLAEMIANSAPKDTYKIRDVL